jgi:hypothetical protein
MVYKAGLPLRFFEHSAVQAFLHRLRPAYQLPRRIRLLTTLLDNSYQNVKEGVEKYLQK